MTEQLAEQASWSTRLDRRMRWVLLGISLAPVIGAFLYNLGLRVTPAKCFFQQMFGFPAPTCGMTRSFMALARGDWQQAIQYHLFAPVLFCLCLIIAALMITELAIGHRLSAFYTGWSASRLRLPGGIAIALLFFGYYGLRLYARSSTGTLPFHWADTALWQLLTSGAKLL
jgi:Protein of unknown function (DUF2752)